MNMMKLWDNNPTAKIVIKNGDTIQLIGNQ